jgi:hypothetical protein
MPKESAIKKRLLKKTRKGEIKQELISKLSGALGDYKLKLGEKKFDSKIKKVSKLFAVDITKAMRKDVKVNKLLIK